MIYTYSILTNFSNHLVNLDKLSKEIHDSTIVTALDYISTNGDACEIYFKTTLSVNDKSTLDGLVANHDGVSLVVVETNLVQVSGSVITSKPSNTRRTIVSHDFTDKTTWYEGSIYVEDEIAQPSGSYQFYTVANQFIIDTYHGKLSDENYLKDSSNRSYRPIVKVNNESWNEQDPHYGEGADYKIDYEAGKIEFLSALTDQDQVKVTYHYASSSVFTIKPHAGKTLSFDFAEIQMAIDVVAKDSSIFQPYGYVQAFAPQYCPNPYPLNTLIPLGDPDVYKGMKDFINISCRAYPKYTAIGGSGWRGLNTDCVVYDWDFVSKIALYSSMGMEIRLKLEHDEPWDGTFATITYYGTEE